MELINKGKTFEIMDDSEIYVKIEAPKKDFFEKLSDTLDNVSEVIDNLALDNRESSANDEEKKKEGLVPMALNKLTKIKTLNSRYKGWYRAEIFVKNNSSQKILIKIEDWEKAFKSQKEFLDYKNLKEIFISDKKFDRYYYEKKLQEPIESRLDCGIVINGEEILIKGLEIKDKISKDKFENLDFFEKAAFFREYDQQIKLVVERLKEEEQARERERLNKEKLEQEQKEKAKEEERKRIAKERKINKCQFDKVNWDMTKEQIQKLEGSKGRIDDNSIFYYGHEKGYDCEYGYVFSKEDGKLWRKYYMFDVDILDPDSLEMVPKFLPVITAKYGFYNKHTDPYLQAQFGIMGNKYTWKKGDTKITLKPGTKSTEGWIPGVVMMLFYDKNTEKEEKISF